MRNAGPGQTEDGTHGGAARSFLTFITSGRASHHPDMVSTFFISAAL